MSLIEKPVTPQLVEANRANSLKSTGPRTDLGKLKSSLNACTHGAFARVTPHYLKELGEDPAEFERLRESLHSSLRPEDDFEALLVDDMAELRWRLMRLGRAQAAHLAQRRWKYDLEDAKGHLLRYATPEDATNVLQRSLIASPDCCYKFQSIVATLVAFQDAIRSKGFEEDLEDRLKSVYGDNQCWIGLKLIKAYRSLRDSHEQMAPGDFDRKRQAFLDDVDDEIAYFRKRLELYIEGDAAIAECRRVETFLPSEGDIVRAVRYETTLERRLERKFRQFVDYRREKGKTLPERDFSPEGEARPQSTAANGVSLSQESEPITEA